MVINLCDECSTGCVKKLFQMKTPMYKFITFVKSPVENARTLSLLNLFLESHNTLGLILEALI